MTITRDDPDLGDVREQLEAEYNSEALAIGSKPELHGPRPRVQSASAGCSATNRDLPLRSPHST
ncbi:MAG: hypothetical protein ACREBE_10600 [bacterium]